ncbi:hypothetical protein BJX70DRAFT_364735 [Aspergillus crustosus]
MYFCAILFTCYLISPTYGVHSLMLCYLAGWHIPFLLPPCICIQRHDAHHYFYPLFPCLLIV